MKRQQQLALPLNQIEPPESLMRTAYENSRLKVSFEDAMETYHFRVCLKHLAMIFAKKKQRR